MTALVEFRAGHLDATTVPGGRYVIADEHGKAIIWRRSNGTSHYMTYRIERTAREGLVRVLPHIPDAKIVEVAP